MGTVPKISGYLPMNWEAGVVTEIYQGEAKVLPITYIGGKIIGDPVLIHPRTHRPIVVDVAGLSFLDRQAEMAESGVREGTWVIFERRFDHPEVAFGWAYKDAYAQALDLFDERFSQRALSWKQRNVNPPREILVPELVYTAYHEENRPDPAQIGELVTLPVIKPKKRSYGDKMRERRAELTREAQTTVA